MLTTLLFTSFLQGGVHLLEGINSLTGSAQFTPVALSLVSGISVSQEAPSITVAVTDLKVYFFPSIPNC